MAKLKTNMNTSNIQKYYIDIFKCISKNYKLNDNKTFKQELDADFDNNIIHYKNYNKLFTQKYTIKQLKEFLKYYSLNLSGVKEELLNRLYNFLRLNYFISKIQNKYRLHLIKKYNKSHGPAYIKRELCTNKTDFLSLEEINDIPHSQFYSYKDIDNYIYGFDVISLYNLIVKSNNNCINPYNRKPFPKFIEREIEDLIKYSKILNIQLNIKLNNETNKLSKSKNIELMAISMFQKMDELGNYTDVNWFNELSTSQLIRFIRELHDIWTYRAQLSITTKKEINPSHDPFYNIQFNNIQYLENIELKRLIITIISNFIDYGINKDSKYLGASYVLSALTLVSHDAASSMPWLYQSVAHII